MFIKVWRIYTGCFLSLLRYEIKWLYPGSYDLFEFLVLLKAVVRFGKNISVKKPFHHHLLDFSLNQQIFYENFDKRLVMAADGGNLSSCLSFDIFFNIWIITLFMKLNLLFLATFIAEPGIRKILLNGYIIKGTGRNIFKFFTTTL